MPYQFLIPSVAPVRLWCLAMGMLILVGAQERLQHRPGTQHLPAQIDFPEQVILGEHNVGAHRAGSGGNAAAPEAGPRVVDAYIRHNDSPGAGLQAKPAHLGDYPRIGVGGLLDGAVPGNVGLDDHHVAARDEAANAAQFLDCAPRQQRGIVALNHYHFGQSRIRRNLKIRAYRSYGRRRGPPAALAQPRAESGRGGGNPTQAKQLNHGFAPPRLFCFGIHAGRPLTSRPV